MPFKLPSLSLKTTGIVLLYIFTFLSGTLFVYITKQDHSTPQVKTNAASLLSFRRESVSALSDTAKIRLLLEDVRSSSKYIYNAKDNLGNGLDGIKVVQPAGSKGYIGIYHFRTNDHFQVKLAESTDLLTWTFITDLEPDASQGDIATFPEGDFLVAYEKNTGADSFITVRHYNNLNDLKTGTFSKEINLDRSLSDTNEGTPNFTKIDKKPFDKQSNNQDWNGSKIALGFHFFTGETDKNATGILTDFSAWNTQADAFINDYFSSEGYKGNYGDRDYFEYTTSNGAKKEYALYEIQKTKDNWASWRTFLLDRASKKFFEVVLYSHAGSSAIGNPTITALSLPDGSAGYFISYFIFSEGAGPNESGELIFYTKDENILKTTRRDKRVIAPLPPTSVPITCTCTTPGGTVPNNGFSCTDGESRYCAENERCTSSSSKPAYPCELSTTSANSPTPTTKPSSTTKPTPTSTKSTPTVKPTSSSSATATPTPTRTPTPAAATNTPTPTQSITCTCTTPGGTVPNNGFSCTDGYTSYCAENEACTTSSTKPAWPCAASQQQPTATPTPEQSITCTCTTPGGTVPNNGFSCTDGYTSYCAENEHCTTSSTKPSWPCAVN